MIQPALAPNTAGLPNGQKITCSQGRKRAGPSFHFLSIFHDTKSGITNSKRTDEIAGPDVIARNRDRTRVISRGSILKLLSPLVRQTRVGHFNAHTPRQSGVRLLPVLLTSLYRHALNPGTKLRRPPRPPRAVSYGTQLRATLIPAMGHTGRCTMQVPYHISGLVGTGVEVRHRVANSTSGPIGVLGTTAAMR